MVLHKHGDKLYNGLHDTVQAHLRKMALEVEGSNDEEFLNTLNKKWTDHKLSMIMIRDILMYMVRSHPCAACSGAARWLADGGRWKQRL